MLLITLPLPASFVKLCIRKILLSPCVLYPGEFHMNNINMLDAVTKSAVAHSKSVPRSVPSALGLQSVVA